VTGGLVGEIVGPAGVAVGVGWLPVPVQAAIKIATSSPLMIRTGRFFEGLFLAM
jgi:hypothetical protein